MASGRIQNRSLLQIVSRLLDLEGIKQFPEVLDLSDIKVVIDIGRMAGEAVGTASPDAEGTARIDEIGNNPIAAQDDFRLTVIEEPSSGAPFDSDVGRRMDAMDFQITFDAAGTTTFNGKRVYVECGYNFDGGDPGLSVPIFQTSFQVQASSTGGQLVYDIPLKGSSQQNVGGVVFNQSSPWNGRIPALTAFYVRVFSPDGTNFPANTTANVFFAWRWSSNTIPPRE